MLRALFRAQAWHWTSGEKMYKSVEKKNLGEKHFQCSKWYQISRNAKKIEKKFFWKVKKKFCWKKNWKTLPKNKSCLKLLKLPRNHISWGGGDVPQTDVQTDGPQISWHETMSRSLQRQGTPWTPCSHCTFSLAHVALIICAQLFLADITISTHEWNFATAILKVGKYNCKGK